MFDEETMPSIDEVKGDLGKCFFWEGHRAPDGMTPVQRRGGNSAPSFEL